MDFKPKMAVLILFIICISLFSGCISSNADRVITGPSFGRNETGAIDGSILIFNSTSNLWEVGVQTGGGAGGNPFDQDLNTTEDVTFDNSTVTQLNVEGVATTWNVYVDTNGTLVWEVE